jgi:hypothetical protein
LITIKVTAQVAPARNLLTRDSAYESALSGFRGDGAERSGRDDG